MNDEALRDWIVKQFGDRLQYRPSGFGSRRGMHGEWRIDGEMQTIPFIWTRFINPALEENGYEEVGNVRDMGRVFSPLGPRLIRSTIHD